MKKQIVKILLVLIILVLSISCISAGVMANSKYGRLTGVNWFGFETSNACPHGLWARDYHSMLQQMKDMGFNCIRLPWSTDVLTATPTSIQINAYGTDAYTGVTGLNTDLAGLNSMQVMDKIIAYAGTLGLYVILDNHSLIHDDYENETLWYTSTIPESTWISGWQTIVTRYQSYANVIGADVKNEPHGNLGTGDKPPATWGADCPGYTDTNFEAAAERCASAILAINPNLVIVVEGVEMAQDQTTYWWGGDLQDVNTYPITTIPAANLEYSYHEYGSGVYAQTWFSASNFPSNMPAIWDQHFYFIKKNGIGQLLMGEFGIQESAAESTTSTDYIWLTTLLSYMGNSVDFTFWSWNPDSGDTGGILQDDWVSVNAGKYGIIKPYLVGTVVPTPTLGSATPTPTVAPATPTPTVIPATPTPTVKPATPTPTAIPGTPTPTVKPGTPTPTVKPGTPTPTPTVGAATPTPTPTVGAATPTPVTGTIKVQFYNSNTATTTNTLYVDFTLVNQSSSAITLSNVTMRYYFTCDTSATENYTCDYASVGTANVTGTFVTMSPAKTNADTYLQIGFTSGAGSLAAGASTIVQGRIYKSDWSNYTQTNDYSFNSTAATYVDWTKTTGYVSGSLQWGTEPN